MKPEPGKHRTPDPELLAAYLDGEFEGRDGLDDLRRLVEGWLEHDPAAQQMARDYRRLKQTWAGKPICDPNSLTWERLFTRVRRLAVHGKRQKKSRRIRVAALGLLGAAAGIAIVFALSWLQPQPPAADAVASASTLALQPLPEETYVLPVARADEVTIQQVEGSDLAMLVVGQLPLQGLLELAEPEDITFESMQPGAENSVPQIRVGNRNPMVWARETP